MFFYILLLGLTMLGGVIMAIQAFFELRAQPPRISLWDVFDLALDIGNFFEYIFTSFESVVAILTSLFEMLGSILEGLGAICDVFSIF